MITADFDSFFRKAVGAAPFRFQREFAEAPSLPQLVRVPTGMGKTAMAVVGWLWRRFGGNEERRRGTPRRLVYCLPMRVLVEQTRDCALDWLDATGLLAGSVEREPRKDGKRGRVRPETFRLESAAAHRVGVHVLMGGEEADDWDMHPERDAILVGTQDMLLSRALNRGYAASRARWPVHFGLLNVDCLWVFDEIQLMGSGLATTAQLEALRRKLPSEDHPQTRGGHGCRSVWMSATMRREWLGTVDFAPFLKGAVDLALDVNREIEAGGLDENARRALEDRWNASKPLAKAGALMGDMIGLAEEIREAHRPGTRTIVIVNTVTRACALFEALRGAGSRPKKGRRRKETRGSEDGANASNTSEPRIVLLHSRFRPADRLNHVDEALAEIEAGEGGTIVVSTQVIEAGVDVSAATLFTELAPWASLVQRFGRCNRRGEANHVAAVRWIDLPARKAEEIARPYGLADLEEARNQLEELTNVGLKRLPAVELPFEHTHVIRRKDLIELFDTTPDLAGNDIDIDRFVREIEDSDVRVFWRGFDQTSGETSEDDAESAPRREELCSVPAGGSKGFREFIQDHGELVWRWDFLEKQWQEADARKIAPGQVFLVHATAGGYSPELGWDPDAQNWVEPVAGPAAIEVEQPDATENDLLSRIGVWQTIAEHADDTCRELDRTLAALPMADGGFARHEMDALRHAARWHDRGKTHEIFQAALPEGAPDGATSWAKAARKGWKRYRRKHFRHELASALAVLDPRNDRIPAEIRDLVAYLVAAHHGKVRLSIRSLPGETRPDGGRRFARGIWDGDELPEADLGNGVNAPLLNLSLEPMELGLCSEVPFAGEPSWAERMLRLRDAIGPFRLAHLEAILRAADWRASRRAGLA